MFLRKTPAVPPVRRLKSLHRIGENWHKIKTSVVNVYKTPLLKSPVKQKKPFQNHFSNKQQPLVTEEIQEMLIKSAVNKITQNSSDQGFLRSLFIIGKADRGNHLVINLKDLSSFIPYSHFKIIWNFSFNKAICPTR